MPVESVADQTGEEVLHHSDGFKSQSRYQIVISEQAGAGKGPPLGNPWWAGSVTAATPPLKSSLTAVER